MNYIYTVESKATPHPPFVINFGDVWPTSEPLSAVLGTNVTKELVHNIADRGSDVGRTSPKLMRKRGVAGPL